jgi:hypothetical protein
MPENNQITPWGLHPLDKWIVDSLESRAKEKGMNPLTMNGNKIYSGPRAAWTRVFSNGISSQAQNLEGFVMGGTEGFNNSFGFDNTNKMVLGVDAFGRHHLVDASGESFNDFPHRPPPSIVSVETEFLGGANSSFGGTCRKTKISWRCFNLSQLDYLTPYFLTPRISVLVEWGWNNYDEISLVDLTDTEWLYGVFMGYPEYTSRWIKASKGNYDLAMGFITDYGYTMNEVGGYDCFTTISNANFLIEGQAYQNGKTEKADSSAGDKKSVVQLKDFKDFMIDDAHNLVVKNKKDPNFTLLKFENIEDRVFNSGAHGWKDFGANAENKVWLKMDLVVDIINKFFSIKFLDKDSRETTAKASTFDITDIPMAAHPALKSTDKNVLFPNQYAPRFVTFDAAKAGKNKKRLNSVKTVGNASTATTSAEGTYYSLFPDILKVMRDHKFDDSYDDLRSVINPKGNSFPMFEPYVDKTNKIGSVKPGYWGYLQDVYISLELFKSLVEKNETTLKLVEALLQHISQASCDISQLKLSPDTVGNGRYGVFDANFSAVNDEKEADKLMRITLGSVNSAFVRSADFGVKLSPEMANQMVMQSASGKGNDQLPPNAAVNTTDPKIMVVSRFSRGDRMFDRGIVERTPISNNSDKNSESDRAKFKRFFDENGNSTFYTFKKGKGDDAEVFILCENDSSFLKSLLLDTKNKDAVYTNNGIMPGTEINIEFLGIAGITFLSQFTLDHVPESYTYKKAVWQVSNVKQKIENNFWTTTITAQARPLTTLK